MPVDRSGCDCPACTGADFDPRQPMDQLIADGEDLLDAEDPLEAEVIGAAFVSVGLLAGQDFEEALANGFVPEFEAHASSQALAMLLAVGSVAPEHAGKAARAAADRMIRAGVTRPAWASELDEPITVTVDCGAASDILLLDASHLAEMAETMRASGLATVETLDAAEFRWQVERALNARAVHDSDVRDEDIIESLVDEDGPGYPALAVLARTRMNALPPSSKPLPPHEESSSLIELPVWTQLGRRTAGTRLPAKRKKSDGPAPVYRIKVGLRGAKPPIWRRLEVPANISLARLHTVIQIAFDWDDSHMHVFETPYGNFGLADPELGHRAEAPVTLEQAAPTANSKLSYTYDFGDSWEHDIVVEKVLDRDKTVAYPRCTGGRRAAPPEDCGGIWGYAGLIETLNNPDHPEHQEMLEWLGIDDPSEFAPEKFDAVELTRALSALR